MKRPRRLWPIVLLAALIEAFAPAGGFIQPVAGAGHQDWNPASYWHGNWGASGVHKGIDIFAYTGTPVVAAQSGRVLYTGKLSLGGNVALLITPRGWLHYYAHLNRIDARPGRWLEAGAPVGTVGATGRAVGRPPHLHYSVLTLIPRLWDFRLSEQGWKRMFYRNPDRLLGDQST